MTKRRGLVLGLVAGALAGFGAMGAHEVAMARQKSIVLVRFQAGYFARSGKFIPVAGRGATNVDRNAVLMFIFSGAVDTGANLRSTLPLTLAEQSELEGLRLKLNEGTATPAEQRRFKELGGDPNSTFDPGAITRRRNPDTTARVVATGSVSSDSVRIVSTAGGGETQARGVFFKVRKPRRRRYVGNRFVFNPRFVVATFNQPNEIDYNPDGFDALTPFAVSIDGGPGATNLLTLVTNLDGIPLSQAFTTTFTTSDRYVQDFTRPEIRTTSPTDGTPNVPSDDDIEIAFNEPMDVATFQLPRFLGDTAATVQVAYTQSPLNGALAGNDVLASVRVKPQTAGNVVQLRPLQGFGRGPHEIQVTITDGVTDLSGNNIIRQQQFVFTTEENLLAEFIGDTVETFDGIAQLDQTFTPSPTTDNVLADWNSPTFPGELTTQVTETAFDITGPAPGSFTNVWFPRAVRWQMLFTSTDMGGRPRTLTGFSWFQDGTQLNLTYPSTKVTIGNASEIIASGGFGGGTAPPGPQASHYGETPVVVSLPSNYTIPATGLVPGELFRRTPGPIWSSNFNTDGQSGVILELEHFGNGTAGNLAENWQIDNAYPLNAMTFSLFQDNPPVIQGQPWYHSLQLNFLTPGAEAQSQFYNTQHSTVRYVPQQVVPFTQPQGTVVLIEWQGGRADVNNPVVLDPSTLSAWTNDIRSLASNPFVRFRVTLQNNLTTQTSPSVDTLTIPFTFR